MNKTILYPLFFLLLLSGTMSVAQNRYTDSIETLTRTIYKDSAVKKCLIYLDLYQQYKQTNFVKSKIYLQKALSIPDQVKDDKIKLRALLIIAIHNLTYKELNDIIPYSIQALRIAARMNDIDGMAKAYYSIGGFYLYNEENKKALDFLALSLRMASRSKNENLEAHISSCFGTIYSLQHQYDSAYVYFNKALTYFEKNNDKRALLVPLLSIAGVLHNQGQYSKSHLYFEKGLIIAREQNNKFTELNILSDISNIYEREKNFKVAKSYADELLIKAEEMGNYDKIIRAKTLLALISSRQQNHNIAIMYAKAALALFDKTKLGSSNFISLYDILVSAYQNQKNYPQAFNYLKLRSHFKDSVSSIENKNYIEEIKQKYNLEKKNEELVLKTALISQIETSDRQKTVIIITLLVILLTALLSVFFYFQRRKIKEELAFKNASYEKQTQYFNAFINGQEQERKRIASDLHDGLAQNLVMLKLGVTKFKLSDQEQQYKLVDYANQIDGMINETRKIAHDMMPDVLMDLGLQKALKSLVNEINLNHPTLKIVVNVVEPFTKIESRIEIQLYRVLQELMNNVIKHSQATKCEIVLESMPSLLSLSFKDNGKGLVLDSKINGMGLNNIYSRINSLNGTVQMNGQLHAGTQIDITIPIS